MPWGRGASGTTCDSVLLKRGSPISSFSRARLRWDIGSLANDPCTYKLGGLWMTELLRYRASGSYGLRLVRTGCHLSTPIDPPSYSGVTLGRVLAQPPHEGFPCHRFV